jgi:hypothetical protein
LSLQSWCPRWFVNGSSQFANRVAQSALRRLPICACNRCDLIEIQARFLAQQENVALLVRELLQRSEQTAPSQAAFGSHLGQLAGVRLVVWLAVDGLGMTLIAPDMVDEAVVGNAVR